MPRGPRRRATAVEVVFYVILIDSNKNGSSKPKTVMIE